ncbi:putative UDP-glucuronate:xylan alpha-glucuronosyltransferase 5 [Andrographis paniculata]|uniref:putative UDP-glucuronate:xylan alpha-glucuronosyltransferase 5 n=1 Tax=Andrographis paniculata TaxID=175694 RepID=UPI0021E8EE28|nr:putative UDP-glucuronate:xylan alpha-glucuronosyltransferase 5 [Andrographis paniculata]
MLMDRVGEELNMPVKRNPDWFKVVRREIANVETINIGLVNIDGVRIHEADLDLKVNVVKVHFTPIRYNEIPWSELSPERMDESSNCPDIPMPRFVDYENLDAVVARVPRRECKHGVMRDVSRLQVNLVVANLLARSRGKDDRDRPVFAVFFDSCDPMMEIFRCQDMLWHFGNSWVYKPELARIKELLLMPVGPCQFVPPFSRPGKTIDTAFKLKESTRQRQAYVTILHTSEDYVCGAIVLAQSIIQSNSTKDLILLVDSNISLRSIDGLRAAGWKIRRIERIRSPYSRKDAYNEWNYSKLRIWQLKQYDKIVFIDADLIANRNLDSMFLYPELTAAGNYQRHLFNSGLMVVEPSECTFRTLLRKMKVVESYNGGDQGFLNEMFAWWHRLPARMNYLKVFVDPEDDQHWIDGDDVFAVHYTGLKPWKCGDEGRDCNWESPVFERYASDSGHRMWWKVYRRMPEELREFCELQNGDSSSSTTSASM